METEEKLNVKLADLKDYKIKLDKLKDKLKKEGK